MKQKRDKRHIRQIQTKKKGGGGVGNIRASRQKIRQRELILYFIIPSKYIKKKY